MILNEILKVFPTTGIIIAKENEKEFVSLLKEGHEEFCGWRECQSPESFRYFQFQSIEHQQADFLRRLSTILEALSSNVVNNLNLSVKLDQCFVISTNANKLSDTNAETSSNVETVVTYPCIPLDQPDNVRNRIISMQKLLVNALNDIILMRRLFKYGFASLKYNLLLSSDNFDNNLCHSSDSLKFSTEQIPNNDADKNLSLLILLSTYLAINGWMQSKNLKEDNHCRLYCNICQREFDLSKVLKTKQIFDPLQQHRSFCPWITDSISTDNLTSDASHSVMFAGWKQCCQRILSSESFELANNSPEIAYKRIRIALDNAVSVPRYSL